MKHFMLFLIAVIAVLALVSSAAPAGATDAPPIETTSMSAEVGTGNVSQTITFGPQYSFYKFRVPNGGMYCQAKIRYTAQEATRVTTMKMSGTECYAMSISVDYGDGFEPWSTSYNVNDRLWVNTPADRPFVRVLYRQCNRHTDSREVVCTKVLRIRRSVVP
ncbi:MAG TPA: hypothetical protein PJ993_03180 [Candidatus Saccharibacteria bacterium]|nr:hypothetical protein [Candidatus Saccharibacteria bacterium]HMT39904.1 hypothetical protein [Candidatus Saccharibacteria bacterium]